MLKNVKKIVIGFENVETMVFPADAVGHIYVDGLHTGIAGLVCESVGRYHHCDALALEIFSEGNTAYEPFGVTEPGVRKFDRLLKYHDVVDISIFYDDGTEDDVYVQYEEGERADENILQKTWVSDLGNLYIVIGEDVNLANFFDIQECNNAEIVSYYKKGALANE